MSTTTFSGDGDNPSLFLAILLVVSVVFWRGCGAEDTSNFEHWLKAKYGYEIRNNDASEEGET